MGFTREDELHKVYHELVRGDERPIFNNEQDDATLVAGGKGCGRGRNRSRGRSRIVCVHVCAHALCMCVLTLQWWSYVVDLATLTGACIIALGPSIAGVFTPSDDLAKEVFAASEVSGEKFWRMPLEESYWESMKSGVADMVNTGGRQGGSITAALFLKQFVDEKVQWMHIDMAGPVWNEKKRAATGFGVSTMVEWILCNSS